METVQAIVRLVSDNGLSMTISVLVIAGAVIGAWGVRAATIAVWQFLKPLIAKLFERHINFMDEAVGNMQKQSLATAVLAEQIGKSGLGEKIDAIHTGVGRIDGNVQNLLVRGCASNQDKANQNKPAAGQ